MLPNIHSPIDRSERFMQRKVAHRSSRTKSRGGVRSSGIACTICQMGCDALSGTAKQLCQMGCNATVC